MKKKIILQSAIHKKQAIVLIQFVYDEQLKALIQSFGAKWSNSLKCWYAKSDEFSLSSFYNQLSPYAFIDYQNLKNKTNAITPTVQKTSIKAQLNEEQKTVANNFYKYLKGKRFSESTLRTYSFMVAEFLVYNKKTILKDIREIEQFIEDVLVPKKSSISTHRQFVSAMNHYLDFIKAEFVLDFKTFAPRKDKKLPNVLSKKEVLRLIQVAKNLKHRVCITLLYSSGLRIGELINLKLHDLDFDRNLLKITMSKGRKDRYVPIANSILPMLNNYLNTYQPTTYLIENETLNQQYSAGSVRKFLHRYKLNAKINKKITPHTLRHSYATHLLESGTDIKYIQTLLGHSKPETTMIYTHVQSEAFKKINNPLDLIVEHYKNSQKNNKFITNKDL